MHLRFTPAEGSNRQKQKIIKKIEFLNILCKTSF